MKLKATSFVFIRTLATKPVAKEGIEESQGPVVHRIRITLTSKNVKNLEKGKLQQIRVTGICPSPKHRLKGSSIRHLQSALI